MQNSQQIERWMSEIEASREKTWNQKTYDIVLSLFEKSEYGHAKIVCRECIDNPPRTNLYAYIKNRLNELQAEKHRKTQTVEEWKKADREAMSPEEWKWLRAVIDEITLWHLLGLAEKNQNPTLPMTTTIDEYRRSPELQAQKSWSPLVDHFLKNAMRPYIISLQDGNEDKLAEFFRGYAEVLKNAREKRTSGRIENNNRSGERVVKDNICVSTGACREV